jgi:hypothetical protein
MPERIDAAGGVHPIARVVYLLAVSVGVFLLRAPLSVGAVVLLQMILWPLIGLPLGSLARQFRKLATFAAAILLTYALFGEAAEGTPAWTFGPLTFDLASTLVGLVMVLRIVAVVLASQIARAGDPHALTGGMRSLGLPDSAALGLDAVLALLGDDGEAGRGGGGGGMGGGGGSGRGGGRGMGGGRGAEEAPEGGGAGRGYAAVMRWAQHLRRRDLRPLLARIDASVERAQAHVGDRAPSGSDLPVVVGITVTMLGIKALKILPGLPYAPGHKLIILLPLYVLAATRTKGRFGATAVGLAIGTVSFLLGDGRYGIFELLKHLAPGVVCDLALPLYRDKERGILFWSAFGAVAAVCRFASEFVVIALAQPPAAAYAILLPGLSSNLFFGTLSGYLTRHVLVAVNQAARAGESAETAEEGQRYGAVVDRGRPHAHPVEVDAGVAGQPGGRGADRQ